MAVVLATVAVRAHGRGSGKDSGGGAWHLAAVFPPFCCTHFPHSFRKRAFIEISSDQ